MKFGLKLFPDKIDLIERYKDIFDYFEMFIKPDTDLKILKNVNVPLIIHATHETYDYNPADPKMFASTKKLLKKAIKAADMVNSKYIIVHCGYDGQEKDMINFFKKVYDKRFLFENISSLDVRTGRKFLFSAPENMKRFLKEIKGNMMLDLGHAILSANVLKRDPIKFIKDFLKLKPKYYHLSGLDFDSKLDMHGNFFDVKNDYKFLKLIPKNSMVTFETDRYTIREKEVHVKNLAIVRKAAGI